MSTLHDRRLFRPSFPILLLFNLPLLLSAQTRWYLVPGGAGLQTGANWANASADLQALIDTASQGDEIWVAAGTYRPAVWHGFDLATCKTFYINKDIKIYGGFTGTETERSQRDWALNPTVLDGDLEGNDDPDVILPNLWFDASRLENAYHVVWIEQVSNAMVLDGLVIQNGNANFTYENGGGIYIAGHGSGHFAHPAISNCTFRRNSALSNGGAIFNDGSDHGSADMTLTNCTFFNNYCGNQGAAVCNWAEKAGHSTPLLTSCLFIENVSDFGGAIFNFSSDQSVCNPLLDNCMFQQNSSSLDGGAIFNYSYHSQTSPVLNHCVFAGNAATYYAGAIYNQAGTGGVSSPKLNTCIFDHNTAGDKAGAVCNDGDQGTTSPEFRNCTFSENSALNTGGAIYNWGHGGIASPLFQQCFFTGNAAADGGAIYNYAENDGASSPVLDSCLFSGNMSVDGAGGAIYNSAFGQGVAHPIIDNCLFSGNTAIQGGAIWTVAPEGTGILALNHCDFIDNSASRGGAINMQGSGTSNNSERITNCRFIGNTASVAGGAIENQWSNESESEILNCIFFNNNASEDGGAMYNTVFPFAQIKVINCTFSNNSAAGFGGAMFNHTCDFCTTHFYELGNCIFWQNAAGTGKSMYNLIATPELYYSLLEEELCPPGAACDDHMLFHADPLFTDTIGNLRLQVGSPAIDAGTNSALAAADSTDLDGNLRISGISVDMGAFESLTPVGIPVQPEPVFALQNFPNPFITQTFIGFQIPEAAAVNLEIIDAFGKLWFSRRKVYPAGYNLEMYEPETTKPGGVLYCTITTPSGRAVRKMIRLDGR